MQSLFIPQISKASHIKMKKLLLDSKPIHLYQPIINNKKQLVAYEFKLSDDLLDLYAQGYTRNAYLYELRCILDAALLLSRHPSNNYLVIINISYKTLEKDDFIDHITSIALEIKSRIVLCLKGSIERYPNQNNLINNRLIKLSRHGFQIMASGEGSNMPLTAFNDQLSLLKLSLAGYHENDYGYICRIASAICKELKIKVILADIDTEQMYRPITLNENIYLEGQYLAGPQKSLINNKYEIL